MEFCGHRVAQPSSSSSDMIIFFGSPRLRCLLCASQCAVETMFCGTNDCLSLNRSLNSEAQKLPSNC